MTRVMVAACLLLLSGGCSSQEPAGPAPTLDPAPAGRLLEAADAARVDAFSAADPAPLRSIFSQRATAALLAPLARLRGRGQRLEERGSKRRLLHWRAGPGRGEGVIEVEAEQRLLRPAGPSPWSRVVRQWRAVLAWSGGHWLVEDAGDLSPDLWWKP